MPAENLLVVDDDQAFLDLMAHHLRRKGHNVACASDGKQALHALQSGGPFDVLVTDLMMPGMSGLELLRLAKKMDPTLEVIVITAAPSLEMAISAMREDGAFDYLTKPLEMISELSLAAERAADHRRMKLEREDLREQLINGANKLRVVLANTTASILAVDELNNVVVASAEIAGRLPASDHENVLTSNYLPEALLSMVSQWHELGCPKLANVRVEWPETESRIMSISPMSGGELNAGGWVMMLHDATTQNRIESFVMQKIISLGQRIRSPMAAATSMLDELANLSSANGAQVSDKLSAIKDCIDYVLTDSSDMSTFVNPMQIENNTRIPLPNFISREELRLDKELEYKNLLDIKWKQEGALPNIEVDLELMHQLLQHLIYWELNARNRSTSIEISCWKQTDRIWFRIGGSEEMPGPAESTVTGNYPIEDVGRMERSEIHLAFAKTFARELKSHLWTWNDENDGPIVAFYVPAS